MSASKSVPLTSTLPQQLQSFDGYLDPRCTPEVEQGNASHVPECGCRDAWPHPNGLHDYMAALSRYLGGDKRVTPVMNAAGLSAADWIRKGTDTKGRSDDVLRRSTGRAMRCVQLQEEPND